MTEYPSAYPRYYEATRTGALLREATRGVGEVFNVATREWQPSDTLDQWKVGENDDVEPLTELEVRQRWPTVFRS